MYKEKARQMVEEFICPGCVNGSDTLCGKWKQPASQKYPGVCMNHTLGTHVMGVGLIALGLPKGFNRPGWDHVDEEWKCGHKMIINCWPKDSGIDWDNHWDKFNIPVWGMEKDGHLFVRTYRPRTNMSVLDVIEGGTLDLVPVAIDVSKFIDDMD